MVPAVRVSPRAGRLAVAFAEYRKRAVPLAEVWLLWAAVDPAGAGNADRRRDLAAALSELEAAGLVTLSARTDVTAAPPLPTLVSRPAPEASPSGRALAAGVVWRPELAWARTATLTPGQVLRAEMVNSWLRDHGHETDRVPSRERSLQIFGHEKVLDAVLSTQLFGPGRLTLELLRTFRTHPPLAGTRVGDGPVCLVAENADTFHSLRDALMSPEGPGHVGFVAWGVGGAFEASVASVPDLGVDRARYFGDLDADGLRIPRNAAVTAHRLGIALAPAYGLYRMLLATGVRQPAKAIEPEQALLLAAWLGDADLVASVAKLLASGMRVPQEALTGSRLAADRSWLTNL